MNFPDSIHLFDRADLRRSVAVLEIQSSPQSGRPSNDCQCNEKCDEDILDGRYSFITTFGRSHISPFSSAAVPLGICRSGRTRAQYNPFFRPGFPPPRRSYYTANIGGSPIKLEHIVKKNTKTRFYIIRLFKSGTVGFSIFPAEDDTHFVAMHLTP